MRTLFESLQKRFYTRGTLRSIRISRLATVPTLEPSIMIGWDPWSKKSVIYLSRIEGKGVGKEIHWNAQNEALFFKNIIEYLLPLQINHDKIFFG